MEDTLINRVAESGLITINLESYYPEKEFIIFDLKDYLFQGLILKEKDFRIALKEHDWTQYTDRIVLISCSADAIIPLWAYMLVTSYLEGKCADIFCGTQEEYLKAHYRTVLQSLQPEQYAEKRIVIKGCSHRVVPASAYSAVTALLQPYAQSIMFGEPCSTVPVFKRPRLIHSENN